MSPPQFSLGSQRVYWVYLQSAAEGLLTGAWMILKSPMGKPLFSMLMASPKPRSGDETPPGFPQPISSNFSPLNLPAVRVEFHTNGGVLRWGFSDCPCYLLLRGKASSPQTWLWWWHSAFKDNTSCVLVRQRVMTEDTETVKSNQGWILGQTLGSHIWSSVSRTRTRKMLSWQCALISSRSNQS